MNSHFFPALIHKAHLCKSNKKNFLEVWGSGQPFRELIYVDDVADACIFFMNKKIKDTLIGAMNTQDIGNPEKLSTDIGPVIDEEAYNSIKKHIDNFDNVYQTNFQNDLGYFIPPTLIEIKKLSDLKNEVFGPVVHIVKYKASELNELIDDINDLGFGLTLGIHSRLDKTIDKIISKAEVGNIYINRNMIGAVVGVQPFGGFEKSGTGPKAGGPEYLKRLCYEQSISNNTAAMGGNASLLAEVDD